EKKSTAFTATISVQFDPHPREEEEKSSQIGAHCCFLEGGSTFDTQQQTRLTSVSFLLHKRHTWMLWRRHRTHTNTRRPEVAVNFTLCFSPIPEGPSPRTLQEQWAASQRLGTN